MTASRTGFRTVRLSAIVVVVIVAVLGVLGYQHVVLGDQDGLAQLRDSPYLEPSPGSVEIGRHEDANRPSVGFDEHRGTIQVISTSPKTEGEVLDYYVSRHGMRESLTSKPTFRRLEPVDGLPGRAVVLLTDTPPRSARFEIDLSRVPAGTQTFITAEVSQSD